MKGRNDNRPGGRYSGEDIDRALHDYADGRLEDDPALRDAVERRLDEDPESRQKVREIREINAAIRIAYPPVSGENARLAASFGPDRGRFLRAPLFHSRWAGVAAAAVAALLLGFLLGRQSAARLADGSQDRPAAAVRLSQETQAPAGATAPIATSVSEATATVETGTTAHNPAFPAIPEGWTRRNGPQGS